MRNRKIYISLFIFISALQTFSQSCDLNNFLSAVRIPIASYPYTSPSSGITVSVTTNCTSLSNFTYPCGPNNYAGSSPAWWLQSVSEYVIFKFSAPIKKLTVLVNGTNQTEVFYFASNGGSPTLSDYCSPDFVASANTVTDVVVPAEGAIISPNVTSATTFTCTHNGLGSGSRITLLDCFVPATILPIELVEFEANCISKNIVKLNWTTASEHNNDYFTIERSNDATKWDVIKNIPAGNHGEKEQYYSDTDNSANGDVIYYRLKQTDKNSYYKYSGIVTVNACGLKNDVEVYPNPATSELTISGRNIKNIQLLSLTGTEVLNQANVEEQQLKLNMEELSPGIYLLRIDDKYYKVVKQ